MAGTIGAIDADHTRHDAEASRALARALDVPELAWYAELPSTMDVAHVLAARGAPSGTLVLADAQTRGRGRGGKRWHSAPGGGLWMTLIDRPTDASGLEVLSLRVGLRAARALDRFAPSPVRLKWPNDLMLPDGKLGGILVEVRWRERRPEWVALGLGVNLRPSGVPGAAALGAAAGQAQRSSDHREQADRAAQGADRETVLGELLPALRAACRRAGPLTSDELREFAERDWARGRRVSAPRAGTVAGISAAGELVILTAGGMVHCATGSLVLDGETP